jgi:hypothetical protein
MPNTNKTEAADAICYGTYQFGVHFKLYKKNEPTK